MTGFSELLAEAKRGDPEALATLYERFAGPVIGAIRKRLSQPLRQKFDSMDLTQSVFAEVLRDLPRVRDLGELSFRRWLYLKVESKVGSKLRKHLGKFGRRRELPLDGEEAIPAAGGSPVSDAAVGEETRRAQLLVSVLDADQRRLVLLRLEDELTFAEIAEHLGLSSAEAARKRYARCLAKLRIEWGRKPR